jgi:hypothetical protein
VGLITFFAIPGEGQTATGEVIEVSVTRAYFVEFAVIHSVSRGSACAVAAQASRRVRILEFLEPRMKFVVIAIHQYGRWHWLEGSLMGYSGRVPKLKRSLAEYCYILG